MSRPLFARVEVARLPEINYTVSTNIASGVGTVDREYRGYINRFALFYTLRWLWKEHYKVGELYEVLGISRTRYDQILQDDDRANLFPLLKTLTEKTGLNEKYFTGEMSLGFKDLPATVWNEYVVHRKRDAEGKKSDALRNAEAELIRLLKVECGNPQKSESLRRLTHFARFKCKRNENDIKKILEQIESEMGQLGKNDLGQLDIEILRKYRDSLRRQLERVSALCIIKDWDNNSN